MSQSDGNQRDFLGVGWKFPLQVTPGGQIAQARYEQRIEESIYLILSTAKGERVMLPEFGCGLRRFLMQPNNGATRAQIEREVTLALRRWEPRIAVTQVDVAPGDDPALVLIEIQYAHVFSGRRDSLVYPFYLE
jgi:Bacteriophage baseplate protein W